MDTSRVEKNTQRGCLGLVLVFVLLIGGGWAYNEITGVESEPRDRSALACDHFRHVLDDASDGVLSDAELRTKLQEVEDDASIASPSVQAAARSLLAAVTSGTGEDISGAASALLDACQAS